MVIQRSTALHMSYTVSAATDAAVIASISTPVCPEQRATARMRSAVLPRGAGRASNVTSTWESSSGWQSGIRSGVRLAAMIPARRAAPRTSPLAAFPAAASAQVAASMTTVASATASRDVSALPETSTILARPRRRGG